MSAVNSQISDSVSDAVATILGNAPSQGFSLLDTVMAETVGMMMHNAVTAQQNAQMIGNAAVTATCAKMLQAQASSSPGPTPSPPIFSPPSSPPGAGQAGANARTAIKQLARDMETSAADEAKAKALLQELAETAKADAEKTSP